jgi:hypothetical protein
MQTPHERVCHAFLACFSAAWAASSRGLAVLVGAGAVACSSSSSPPLPSSGLDASMPVIRSDGGPPLNIGFDGGADAAGDSSTRTSVDASLPDAAADAKPPTNEVGTPDAGVDAGGSCAFSGITQCSGQEVQVCGDDLKWGPPMACSAGLECLTFSGDFATEAYCGVLCTKVVTTYLSLAITDENLASYGIMYVALVGGGGGAGGTAGGGGGGGSSVLLEQNTSLSPFEANGGPGGGVVGGSTEVPGSPGISLEEYISPDPGETVVIYVGGGGGGGASEMVAGAGGGGSGYNGGAGGQSQAGGEGGGAITASEPGGGFAGGSTIAMAGGAGAGTRGGAGGSAATGGSVGMNGGGGGGGGYGAGGGSGETLDGGVAGAGGSSGADGTGSTGGLGANDWMSVVPQAGAAGKVAGQAGNGGIALIKYLSPTGVCSP